MITKHEQEFIIRMLNLELLEFKGDVYNFRCEICGDSTKNKHKKRGFLYWDNNKQEFKYKCHNCGVSFSFFYYLKTYHKDVYQKYVIGSKFSHNKYEKAVEDNSQKAKIDNNDVKKVIDNLFLTKKITKISECDDEIVTQYVKERMIPEKKWKELYYTKNFYNYLYKPLKQILGKDIQEKEIFSDERIFWFIRDRTNNIIGIQGRAISKKQPIRYLSVKITDECMIGGLENINIKDKIYITEGYIDSLFIDNAVSMNNASFTPTITKFIDMNIKNIVIVYDNEPYNKEIKKVIKDSIEYSIKNKHLIKLGICLLPKELRIVGKDINEYIKNGISQSKLINIIDENTFYDIEAKLKFIKWGAG
jgi:transcriptional regulator NrdR family protein